MTAARPPRAYPAGYSGRPRRSLAVRILRRFAVAGLIWMTGWAALALWLIRDPLIADPYLTLFTAAMTVAGLGGALLILVAAR